MTERATASRPPGLFRLARAFTWLRWRLLMNALEGTGNRDTWERFSRAIEYLGPTIFGLMLVPSALALGIVGLLAGAFLFEGPSWGPALLRAVWIALVAVLVAVVFSPLMFPAGRRPQDLVRLLLLPIPRRLLYVGEVAGAMLDPWIVLVVPLLALLPIGVLWTGHVAAGLVAIVASTLMLALLLGVSLLSASLLQLVMRDRRRAELIALLVVLIPLVAMLPSLLLKSERDFRRTRQRQEAQIVRSAVPSERSGPEQARSRAPAALRAVALVLPPRLYTASIARVEMAPGAAGLALAVLALFGTLAHGLSWMAYGRLLAGPATARRPTSALAATTGPRRLAGLTAAASAVTVTFVRLAYRTPRGRVVILTPPFLVGLFAVVMLLRDSVYLGMLQLDTGLALAIFGVTITLLSVAPLTVNQFAVDQTGLTLQLLSPIPDRDLLVGKAAGAGLIVAGPALACLAVALAFGRGAVSSLWVVVLLGTLAAYLVLAPIWAILSALFPRAVTLSSIGRGSNPHPAANLLGILATGAAAAPLVGLAALAPSVLQRPLVAVGLAGIWCVVAWFVGQALMRLAAKVFARRRENLALVAQGR